MYAQPTNCPNCGAPLQPGRTQCPNCGAPVSQNCPPNYGPCPGQPSPQWLANDAFASGPSGRSRGVAALFAILLNGLGIQYFYCGKIMAGILTIIISLVTCGLWGVLMLIQGILMLCMTNQEFEAKYVNTNSSFPLF